MSGPEWARAAPLFNRMEENHEKKEAFQDPDKPFIVHQLMQPVHGIWFLENVNPTQLAEDKVYEFAFIFTPLPLKGATGTPGDPIAIDY